MKEVGSFGTIAAALLALVAAPVATHAQSELPPEPVEPAPHFSPWPDLGTGQTPGLKEASFSLGPEMVRGRGARDMLRDRRRLDAALGALEPQRPGTIDAYVISVALDSDPVFAREAREAGNVLSRRYDGEGRTVVLAGPDGRNAGLPRGSISSLIVALAQVAEVMDTSEDVLVLYTTSHGTRMGLAYHEGDTGFGILSPPRLRSVLSELGLERRILFLSACYSGVFMPFLAGENTAIATASAHDRTSFGCQPDNDWTFFGDALINRALRQPQALPDAFRTANVQIARWEAASNLEPSQPQWRMGNAVNGWLRDLEARMPRSATAPVGRSSVGD